MKFFRRIFKISAIVICFPVFFLAVLFCNGWRRKWDGIAGAVFWTKIWARGICFLTGMKIKVYGEPENARGKLVISNHTGYLDVFAQGAVFPVRFAPKAEMRNWPFAGALVSLARPVWIYRRQRSKAAETAGEIRETLEHKFAMLVYPEGTSTDGKHGLLPFKSTAFEAALSANAVLLPVLIVHRGVPEGDCETAWFGDTAFLSHLWSVLGLKEIHTSVYIMPEQSILPGEDRKALAERMHRIMTEQYKKGIPSAKNRDSAMSGTLPQTE